LTNGGIFGPKLSGKTTLAVQVSRLHWIRHRMRSLVLDPWLTNFGPQAWVTKDEDAFWRATWSAKEGSLVIVDESTRMIARNQDLIPVFTELRHKHHKLLVIGHDGVNLLPIMRAQIDTLYLFRSTKKAATIWAENFTQDGLLEAMQLGQHEFLFTVSYGRPRRFRLQLPAPQPSQRLPNGVDNDGARVL
jgi:hypothetical protein